MIIQLCYKLTPRFVKGSTIYAPVENEKTVIRSVMSREEAQAVLNRVKQLETLWVKDEKEPLLSRILHNHPSDTYLFPSFLTYSISQSEKGIHSPHI